MNLQTLNDQSVSLGGPGWKMVVTYRGAHCPVCKQYLADLEGIKEGLSEQGIEFIPMSADQKDRAVPIDFGNGIQRISGSRNDY